MIISDFEDFSFHSSYFCNLLLITIKHAGAGIFLFTILSIMALGSTQPPIQWVPGALSLGVERPEREADTHLNLMPRSSLHSAVLS
jgi:hypothetical protein